MSLPPLTVNLTLFNEDPGRTVARLARAARVKNKFLQQHGNSQIETGFATAHNLLGLSATNQIRQGVLRRIGAAGLPVALCGQSFCTETPARYGERAAECLGAAAQAATEDHRKIFFEIANALQALADLPPSPLAANGARALGGHNKLQRSLKCLLTLRHHFSICRNMKKPNALAALAALAQDNRLDIFRLLVKAGRAGMAAGNMAGALKLAPNTLTFHLDRLREADLVTVRREGRSMIYAARYDTMNGLLGFLSENCCQGNPEECLPADTTKASRNAARRKEPVA